jgi:Transglycosylase-like domain
MLSAAQLSALRQCESGGNYQSKSNPAYRGAYQIARGTWDITVVRMHRPDLVGLDPADASPADQDAAAQTIYQADGLGAWPTCGANL